MSNFCQFYESYPSSETHLDVLGADVDLSLFPPVGALVDDHPLLWPLELVGKADGDDLDECVRLFSKEQL